MAKLLPLQRGHLVITANGELALSIELETRYGGLLEQTISSLLRPGYTARFKPHSIPKQPLKAQDEWAQAKINEKELEIWMQHHTRQEPPDDTSQA